ncbi:MAG: hypothetical protein JXQ74_03085 [Alphaproteobacteria bacterium]|nr:hypothetical protein [Alphaproteobacteria bacterium]
MLFAFCISESSFAVRGGNRESNRSDAQSETINARRGSSPRRGATGRVAVGTPVNRTRLRVDMPVKQDVVEEDEEELPEIEEIKKVVSFKKYTPDINELITRISVDSSRVGIGGVKNYSYTPEKCVAGFQECSIQNSICGKNFSSCLDYSEIELEEKTWFCQKTLMKKCEPDIHESMFDNFMVAIENARAAKTEADRVRAERLAEEKRRKEAAAEAERKRKEEAEIYALACKNAGGQVQNQICLVNVTLQYPGGTADTALPAGERAYCNATTFGYDPINKLEVKQKKNRAWITAAGAVVGAAGGALVGNSIENNMEEKADDFEEYLNEEKTDGKNIKKNKATYLGKCEEAGIREKKCTEIVDEYIDDNYGDEDADDVDKEIEEFAEGLSLDYEDISQDVKSYLKNNLDKWKKFTAKEKEDLKKEALSCQKISCLRKAMNTVERGGGS